MNLQQLKAKYANNATSAGVVTKVDTTTVTAKAWNSTKSAAVKTGSFVRDISPATNRRVDSIAAELNARYNNHEMELVKHEILIQMVADATGVTLPEDGVIEEYAREVIKEREAEREAARKAQEAAESKEEDEVKSMADKFMKYVTAAFEKNGYAPKPECPVQFTEDAKELFREELGEEEEAEEQVTQDDILPEPEEEEAPKEKVGRRRLGRQAPLAE